MDITSNRSLDAGVDDADPIGVDVDVGVGVGVEGVVVELFLTSTRNRRSPMNNGAAFRAFSCIHGCNHYGMGNLH
jgi:hypothetical protein